MGQAVTRTVLYSWYLIQLCAQSAVAEQVISQMLPSSAGQVGSGWPAFSWSEIYIGQALGMCDQLCIPQWSWALLINH